MPGSPAPNFPPDSPVDFDVEKEEPVGFVLDEGLAQVRSDWDSESGDERRPNVHVFVALVDRREAGGEGYLLPLSKENDSDREVVVEKSLLSSVVLEEDTATKEDDKGKSLMISEAEDNDKWLMDSL
ncbi:uncharacterized protein A4U43_C02F7690 [Asparagus officinalis]|uniref:Uncharacterized protein n=1 Tax=Asparagus officinalis TaxID=4686 RepID=A0A5P1FGP9_ASPOF|nr:uncharacterized protein A4U43_C02F7690 [Asparagus officinalis]